MYECIPTQFQLAKKIPANNKYSLFSYTEPSGHRRSETRRLFLRTRGKKKIYYIHFQFHVTLLDAGRLALFTIQDNTVNVFIHVLSSDQNLLSFIASFLLIGCPFWLTCTWVGLTALASHCHWLCLHSMNAATCAGFIIALHRFT